MESLLQKRISELEAKNKNLEDLVLNQTKRIETLEARIETLPFMEDIKKWTCEYIERELDDIHPLKDRWESTEYLQDYGGCIGYYYRPPRTTSSAARQNAQIHYNRSEVMKEMEIRLSD